MDTKFEKLQSFFDKIKTVNFWQRIFGWRQIRDLSFVVFEEFKKLIDSFESVQKEKDQLNSSKESFKINNQHLEEKAEEQGREITSLKMKIDQLINEKSQLSQENVVYKKTDDNRRTDYEKKVATLEDEIKHYRNQQEKEQEESHQKEIARLESMKETWTKHQEKVKNAIKLICERRTIDYIDKVPFKGAPDNTIKICDEFVIFDAKSPLSDDLSNFPTYIKAQAESVKKYIKEENVRKDIFLVIPSNTVDVIEEFSYPMGDYTVYVITLDVLEPLILNLKKIESYEFVNELTPEERDNICAIIGKFAHMTKRRIQVDQFFAMEFLSVLTKCGAVLPEDILKKVIEFEKAEKLNPPQDRRAKQITDAELKTKAAKIKKEAEAKGIVFSSSAQKDLKGLPLYKGDKSDSADS